MRATYSSLREVIIDVVGNVTTKQSPPNGMPSCEQALTCAELNRLALHRMGIASLLHANPTLQLAMTNIEVTSLRGVISDVVGNVTTKQSPPNGMPSCEQALTCAELNRLALHRMGIASLLHANPTLQLAMTNIEVTSLRGVISDVVGYVTTKQSRPDGMHTWNRQSCAQSLMCRYFVVQGLLRAHARTNASARNDVKLLDDEAIPPNGMPPCEQALTCAELNRLALHRMGIASLLHANPTLQLAMTNIEVTSLREVIIDVVDNMTTKQSPPNGMPSCEQALTCAELNRLALHRMGIASLLHANPTLQLAMTNIEVTSLRGVISDGVGYVTTKQSPPDGMCTWNWHPRSQSLTGMHFVGQGLLHAHAHPTLQLAMTQTLPNS